MQGKDGMSAVIVGNLLPVVLPSILTREFTLVKSPINAMNVRNLLLVVLPYVITNQFIVE